MIQYSIIIRIGQDVKTRAQAKLKPDYANKFDDTFSSDFIVKCKDSIFHVHQWILSQRSEYFAAIIRNECLENQKELLVCLRMVIMELPSLLENSEK